MSSIDTQLIVGLGNPGAKYLLTPHNIGWIVVDALAYHLNIKWRMEKKLSSEIAGSPQEKILLLKPQTYMNLSGEAVQKTMNYYRIPLENILIIHDEIDLPFLSLRFHKDRGAAGHNGIKSITQELGSQNYSRMRIGMQAMEAPDEKTVIPKRQVLKPFTKAEQELLPKFLEKSFESITYFKQEGLEKTANRYNS